MWVIYSDSVYDEAEIIGVTEDEATADAWRERACVAFVPVIGPPERLHLFIEREDFTCDGLHSFLRYQTGTDITQLPGEHDWSQLEVRSEPFQIGFADGMQWAHRVEVKGTDQLAVQAEFHELRAAAIESDHSNHGRAPA